MTPLLRVAVCLALTALRTAGAQDAAPDPDARRLRPVRHRTERSAESVDFAAGRATGWMRLANQDSVGVDAETVDGEPCWRVQAEFGGTSVTFWIQTSRALRRQVMQARPDVQIRFRRASPVAAGDRTT